MAASPGASKANKTLGEEAQNGIATAIRALRKHWPLLLAAVLLGGGLSLVYSRSVTRVYQSVAMIELDPSVQRPLSDKVEGSSVPLGTGDFLDNREYYETQYKIITSTRVLQAAARNLPLQNDYSFFGLKAPAPQPFTIEQIAAAIRPKVTIEPVRNSRLVLIKVDDTVPERARKVCDAIAAAYIESNLDKAVASTSDSVVWLAGQVETVKKELEKSEDDLHAFKQRNALASTSINESANMVRVEMTDLSSALTRTRTRRQEVAARLAELNKVSDESPDQLPATELLSNSFLQDLRRAYQEALGAHNALIAEGKGPKHPLVAATGSRVAETRSALLAEIRNIKGALERDLAAVSREEAGNAGLYEDAHKRGVDLTMKEIEYHRLERTREQNEKMYGMLLENMKGADLARMMRVNNVHLIEAASTPTFPIFPRTRTNLTFGLLIGLLLGIGLVFVREALDNTLKTPDDVEELLGVPVLGLLPLTDDDPNGKPGKKRLKLRTSPTEAAELLVHTRPLSGVAEAARSIRTNLVFASPDKPIQVLLVTSSAPSEGKTTVASSIAIALAQSGQRVCLIDCDLRRPRLHRIFSRAGDAGVTSALVGDASLDDVARPTMVDNLFCIPAGPIPPNPADMLHSERFRSLLRDLRGKFDRIVIDSPPLVAVTDSAIIATEVDGCVFVMRAFSTQRALAKQGLRTLTDVDAPVVGAVLNAVDLNKSEYAYRQYYYYKRDGYGPRPSETPHHPGDDEQTPAAPAS